MESATFRDWLAERGCRFSQEPEARGLGQGAVMVHREGRTAELPLAGSRKPIDPATAQAICEALALDWSQLPGPTSRA